MLARLSSPSHRIGAVIGSPGSGKTVLLAQWVRSMPAQSVCWLNADQADRDPVRFWQAAIAAVRSVRPGFGQESLDLLVLDHDVHHDMLEALLAACEGLAQPVVLVIDDFQFVDASIAEHLRFLLTRGAGNLRLAIGSRAEPAISMARLRMAGDLCEIREPDLRFDRQAAGALLENLKVAVRSADLDVVMTRTEGWAAGVHLAAVALRGVDRPDRFVERLTGNNQVIADYLWAELYEAQSVDIQRFLLDTCIVDELTPALAAALSPSTPVSLAEIEEANLLLNRLDAEGRSFRYHHLLAEMLRLRLRAHDPQHELVLHERAARWHAAYGDPRVAFRHRWRAGQRTEAITSIHGTIVDAYYTNRLPSIVDTECTLADEDLVAAPGPSPFARFGEIKIKLNNSSKNRPWLNCIFWRDRKRITVATGLRMKGGSICLSCFKNCSSAGRSLPATTGITIRISVCARFKPGRRSWARIWKKPAVAGAPRRAQLRSRSAPFQGGR